ncbi:MAG: M48 family metalloprotease [Candidatus Omnitrophica bacterium]|nr:M48 family metalloprotease [Candidatus Omnitrophota bacterium]
MPYSFTQIEKDKTRVIGFVFLFLIAFYFGVFWLIALLVKNFVLYEYTSPGRSGPLFLLNFHDSLIIFALAILVGYVHWTCTVSGLVGKISGVLKAEPLNPGDHYHQRLQNIINEVSVATGGKKIEGMVIPTTAMNAFALTDFKGRAIIGVTEGLLARLTRPQLEAVVGHEAAHIVAGDCLATTVTTSIFALYGGLLKGLERIFSETRSSRDKGGVMALLLCIYILLWVTRGMSQLVRMFISRQREYRADAVAVRLTRDPLSLAEALYAIDCRWRGAGLAAEELESIFIVNPAYSALDEKTSLFADMFSTHPPVKERLNVLLEMAHADMENLIQSAGDKNSQPRSPVPQPDAAQPAAQWMVHRNGLWEGPFDLARLLTIEGMRPETWVQRVGTTDMKMAYEDPEIIKAINKKTGSYHCPKCAISLTTVIYEGVEVLECSFCRGVLVAEKDATRIIIREEVGFSEEVTRLAARIVEQKKIWQWGKDAIKRDPGALLTCPRCEAHKGKMIPMFYTAAYHVEIDKCLYCGSIWFDKNELEVLQCLIEHQTEQK